MSSLCQECKNKIINNNNNYNKLKKGVTDFDLEQTCQCFVSVKACV